MLNYLRENNIRRLVCQWHFLFQMFFFSWGIFIIDPKIYVVDGVVQIFLYFSALVLYLCNLYVCRIRTIDAVIITHSHADAIGGLSSMIFNNILWIININSTCICLAKVIRNVIRHINKLCFFLLPRSWWS